MRFRTIVALTMLAVVGLMSIYMVAYGRNMHHRVEREVAGFAKVFANLLGDKQKSNAISYAHIIVDQGRFRSVTVTHLDGTPFAAYRNNQVMSPFDRALNRCAIIPIRVVSHPVLTPDHERIGTIEAEWINRNFHNYLAFGGPLATACLLLLVSGRYRYLKEERLRDRLHLEEERYRRLQSQQDLAEAQAQFKDLVESANDIIYETNLHGHILYANPVAERIMKHSNEVLLARRYSDFIRSSYRNRVVRFYRHQLKERNSNTYLEFPVVTGTKQIIWLGQNVQLVLRDGRPVGFRAVARDITRLKAAADEIAHRDERMQEEMKLAKMIHQALLPIQKPTLEGFEFGVKFIPSGEIGGDFINLTRFPDPRRIGIMFADITGHGVAAALLAAMLKVLVDEIMASGRSPKDCFRILNQRLAHEYPEGNFASAFYAVLDGADRTCTYVKASQEPALLVRPGSETVVLEEGGPALGLLNPDSFGDPDYVETRVQLLSGDTLFFYTDGLVEIDPTDQVTIERDELIAWVEAERDGSPQALVDAVYALSRKKAGTEQIIDDVAMLAIRVL